MRERKINAYCFNFLIETTTTTTLPLGSHFVSRFHEFDFETILIRILVIMVIVTTPPAISSLN